MATMSNVDTEESMDPWEVRLLIQKGEFTPDFENLCLSIVGIIVEMGRKLFPHSHILREDIKRQVQGLAVRLTQILDSFHLHVGLRVQRACRATKMKPSLIWTNKVGYKAVMKQWRQLLQ